MRNVPNRFEGRRYFRRDGCGDDMAQNFFSSQVLVARLKLVRGERHTRHHIPAKRVRQCCCPRRHLFGIQQDKPVGVTRGIFDAGSNTGDVKKEA